MAGHEKLNWDGIRLFVAIVDSGSLTQATQVTKLSQPTISRHLKQLEDSLGGRLFHRLPNQLVLTKLGAETVELGRAMNAAAENLQRKAKSLLSGGEEPLRITASSTLSHYLASFMPDLIAAARPYRSEVQFYPTRIPINLSYRQADIALRLRQLPEHGSVRARKIGRQAFTMYARREQTQSGMPDGVIALIRDRPPPQPEWVDEFAENAGLPIVARLGEFSLRHEAVRAGLGATLLPCLIGDADSSLRRICPPPEILMEEIFLLVHDQSTDNPAVAAVAKVIALHFKRDQDRISGLLQTTQPPEYANI